MLSLGNSISNNLLGNCDNFDTIKQAQKKREID